VIADPKGDGCYAEISWRGKDDWHGTLGCSIRDQWGWWTWQDVNRWACSVQITSRLEVAIKADLDRYGMIHPDAIHLVSCQQRHVQSQLHDHLVTRPLLHSSHGTLRDNDLYNTWIGLEARQYDSG